MKYPWEVWHFNDKTGLYDDQQSGPRGYTEAASPQALVDQLGIDLGPGDRLMVWDTVGVGRPPVLVVEAGSAVRLTVDGVSAS